MLTFRHSQQQTLVEVLHQCGRLKSRTTTSPEALLTSYTLPSSDASKGSHHSPTLQSVEAPKMSAPNAPLVANMPMPSEDEQRHLEDFAKRNLPMWEQDRDGLLRRVEQLSDNIELAKGYIAGRKDLYSVTSIHDRSRTTSERQEAPSHSTETSSNIGYSKRHGTIGENDSHGIFEVDPCRSSRNSVANTDLEPSMTDPLPETTLPEPYRISSLSVTTENLSQEEGPTRTRQFNERQRPRKRRRLSRPLILQTSSSAPEEIFAPDKLIIPNSTTAFAQKWSQPAQPHRNRLSRIMLGQLAAIQREPQEAKLSSNLSPKAPEQSQTHYSERPASYPQSQRWRKSWGISVRALQDGFKNMQL